MAKKNTVNNNFGKDVAVVVINKDSPFYEQTGFTISSSHNKDGQYEIKLQNGNTELIHANDLDLYEQILSTPDKPYIILEAAVKDGNCNYKYKITSGVGEGDTHGVSGTAVVHDDFYKSISVLNVHLACIDDAFKRAGIEIKDIDKMHGDELTQLYDVTGFAIKGQSDDECVILIGSKYVSSAGGRIEIKTPKIPLDNMSSYPFYNELKEAVYDLRYEVAEYKEGKIREDETDDKEQPNPKQLTIGDAISQSQQEEDKLQHSMVDLDEETAF